MPASSRLPDELGVLDDAREAVIVASQAALGEQAFETPLPDGDARREAQAHVLRIVSCLDRRGETLI